MGLFYFSIGEFLMADKLTYEELEQRIKELEKDALCLRKVEDAHREQYLQLQKLSEASFDGVVIMEKGVIQEANQTFADLYGYELSEIIGMDALDFIAPESKDIVLNKIITGYEKRYEATVQKKDGKKFEVEACGAAITYKGRPARITAMRDITKRKQAEEALRESEKRYRAVVESQAEMICRFIPDGTLTFVNGAYCRYFDKGREELIGHKFMPLIPESDRDKVSYNIASLNPNTPVITHEHRVFAPNGEICWHKWTNRAIFDDKSNLMEYQAVGWDITNRVRVEKSLQKANKELEHRVKERTKDLGIKTIKLEEVNTALRVLIDKRDEDKINLEKNILSNVNKLVLPYLHKVKKIVSDDIKKTYLEVIESSINEIISPFSNKLSSIYINLTPAEMQVADFVKHGKRSKEIAIFLNLSVKTIESHRESIRKKIGIKNKKTNLRSYLLSLQ